MNLLKRIDRQVLRVDTNFALCESSYWVSYCCLSGFATIYLSYRGLTNTQIGLTTSISCAMAILLQLLISSILDKRPSLPIKAVIAGLFGVGMISVAMVHWLPLPIAMMTVAYAMAHSMGQCNNGYLNAMLIQFNNVGINAHYGWPRGMGSIFYAAAAWLYGVLAEKYTPAILMPIYLAGTAVTILCVLMMPNPYRIARTEIPPRHRHATTYREMLSGNPTLVVLMVCTFLNSIGNTAGYGFIIRVIEGLGGGTAEYGVSEFIRAASEMPMLLASTYLLKNFKAKHLLVASYLFFGIRVLALAFAPSIGFVYGCSLLNMLSVGINIFASVLFVNKIVGPTEKIRGQSLSVLCGSLGSILGNLLGGAVLDLAGLRAMLIIASGFCFLGCAGLLFLCNPEKHGLPG